MTSGFANIGPKGQRFRTVMGVISFNLGIALVITLIVLGAGWWYRLLAYFLFYFGLLGILQARSGC